MNLRPIETMLARHKAGANDFCHELWGLLVLEYWFQEFQVGT